jgi:hypothetical protein
MDVLISLLVVIAIGIPIGVLVATWGLRGPEIIGAGFTGYRPDGWPRGVQERDVSWNWRAPESPAEPMPDVPEATIVEIQPVHARLERPRRNRSARG